MALFEPIEVTWDGETKEVAPNRVMQVLANMEESLTFQEAWALLVDVIENGSRKQIKVCTTYHSFLRSCGFRVEVEEVMSRLDIEGYILALKELLNVLKLTIPPDERKVFERILEGNSVEPEEPTEPKGEEGKKPEPGE